MAKDEELLKYRVGVDVESAKKAISDFNKAMKSSNKLPGLFDKAEKKSLVVFQQGVKKNVSAIQEMRGAFKDAEKSSQLLYSTIQKHEKEISTLRAKYADQSTDENKQAVKEAQERAKGEIAAANEAFDHRRKKAEELSDEIKKQARDAADDMKSAFQDSLSSLKSKDAFGLAGSLAKGMKAGTSRAGLGLQSVGAKAADKGAAMGGIGGTALKGLGAFADKAGGLLQIFTKIGPLVGTLSSSILGIVKLFLDVDATGKAINKELLEGASTADTFAKSGWDTQKGYDSLSSTLQEVKDQAYGVGMNLSMGTSAKDHLAVINVLKREGLTLQGLKDQLDSNAQSADKTTRSVSSFADVTKMSIGYSRLLGVSIDEIGTMQSEMMTELGESLGQTKLEFSRMTDAANESGIAANKFFGIIRGVSADLSLYGMRLKDVTKTMSMLGKVMSPRSAQKFMQALTGTFKDQGASVMTKLALLGGTGAQK